MPASFVAVSGRVAGIPLYAILIMAGVFFLGWYALRYTRVGRYTYAIGGNENCAKLSGINLGRTKCLVYTISGLCCGVAALLLTSRLDSAVPTNADGQEMDAIAAVVIGGTSMKGGEGSMIGTLIGIMIIGVISNGLNLLGVAQGPQRMVKGLIIVVAVIIDVVRRKAAEAANKLKKRAGGPLFYALPAHGFPSGPRLGWTRDHFSGWRFAPWPGGLEACPAAAFCPTDWEGKGRKQRRR